jgi:hypothetical protein
MVAILYQPSVVLAEFGYPLGDLAWVALAELLQQTDARSRGHVLHDEPQWSGFDLGEV